MTNKWLSPIALLLPLVCLLIWNFSLWAARMNVGNVVIAAEGYDPRSLVSGHYLNLRLNWLKTDCSQFPYDYCPDKEFDNVYRFYVPENEARTLEKTLQNRREVEAELVFGYDGEGRHHLRNLLLDGQPWDEWLAAHHRGQKHKK